MAFGVKREQLREWKQKVKDKEIAFLTHYWYDPRFPDSHSVTKVGCADLDKLINWGMNYQLDPKWIDRRDSFPHFDLMGDRQYRILKNEGYDEVIAKFRLQPKTFRD